MSGASRVNTSRAAAAVRSLDTTPPTPVGAAGVTERGPFTPQLVVSYADYQQNFGGPTLNSQDMDLAAKSFFDEGGKVLHVARVVHYTDATDTTTKQSAAGTLTLATATPNATSGAASSGIGPFALANGDQLTVKVDNGGVQTVTFSGTAASRASGAGPFTLADGQTLTLQVDGSLTTITKTFHASEFSNVAAATPAEVANALNTLFASISSGSVASVTGGTHVTITSNRLGTGSGINVTGGSANAALGFTTGAVTGTGNVSSLAAVTPAEVAAALAALPLAGGAPSSGGGRATITSSTTGLSSTVQVTTAGAAGAKLGFDTAIHAGIPAVAQNTIRIDGKSDGSYANALSIQIAPASNGLSDHFNLYVVKGGVQVERFFNLSLSPTASDYAVTVVNQGAGTQTASNLIMLTDLTSAVPSPGNLPAAGTFGPLTGGADGIAGLADADYAGASGTNGPTGIRLFDTVEDLSILIVPGRATAATHNAMVTYCEVTRGGLCFAILDPPAGLSIAQMRTYFTITASLKELSELFSAYYPRVLVDNPNTTVFGNSPTLTAAPSGLIAGLCARIDASKDGGSFEQPASIEDGFLRTARGLEPGTDVRDITKRGFLFDDRINPIMSKKGQPIFVDGARTGKSTGPFPSVGESRGILFLQQTIGAALDPKRNKNNRPRLRNEILMLVENFMQRLTKKECFASDIDAQAWFFDIGDALNSAAEQKARNVNARLGVATASPGEFINIVFAPFQQATLNNTNAAA